MLHLDLILFTNVSSEKMSKEVKKSKRKHHGTTLISKREFWLYEGTDVLLKLLILLTYHCNGDFVLQVRISVIASNFNPEMKRSYVTLLKRINLQGTILFDISQLLGSTSILLHDFRGNRVVDELIMVILPIQSELSDRPPWIRVSI